MRLSSITFTDFRQFEGTQIIRIANDDMKNCTVLFGTNGAGKTTTLVSCLWALYGYLPPDFKKPSELLSLGRLNSMEDGDIATASVKLDFSHDGSKYTLLKEAYCRRVRKSVQNLQETKVTLFRIDPTGASEEVFEPVAFLDQLLPQKLAPYFFLNGENLSASVEDNLTQLGSSIKTVLKIGRYERAVEHSKKAETLLRGSMAQLIGGEKFEQVRSEHSTLLSNRTEVQEQIHLIDERKFEINVQIEQINQQLREYGESKSLQHQRDELTTNKAEATRRFSSACADRNRLVNMHGVVAFMHEMSLLTLSASDVLRTRGELPASIKVQFIDDLLEAGRCICDSPLEHGSVEFEAVYKWRQRAGLLESEEAWVKAGAYSRQVESRAKEFRINLGEVLDRIKLESDNISSLTQRITAISQTLLGLGAKEIEDLEKTQGGLVNSLFQLGSQKNDLETQLEQIDKTIKFVEDQIERAATVNKAAAYAKKKLDVLVDARKSFEKILEIKTELARRLLQEALQNAYSNIALKAYSPRVGEDFELSLMQISGNTEVPAAPSRAENQSLYLSFIAALTAINHQLNDVTSKFEGGRSEGFPIMLDSAFGDFDIVAQQKIFNGLADSCHQVVLLVSSAQGQRIEGSKIQERIGNVCVATLHGNKGDLEDEDFEYASTKAPYIRRISPESEEHSRIVEIPL